MIPTDNSDMSDNTVSDMMIQTSQSAVNFGMLISIGDMISIANSDMNDNTI